jgi:hypothetical protein
MIEILNRPHSRVWLDEHPSIKFRTIREITTTLTAEPRLKLARRAGVEVSAARDVSSYALICGDFIPDDHGPCFVRLPVSDDSGMVLPWSLLGRYDEVRAGLPEEFAQHVLDAGSSAAELLGSGVLTLAPAAYCAGRSSQWIFSRVTSALIEIMALIPETVTSETLAEIIRR